MHQKCDLLTVIGKSQIQVETWREKEQNTIELNSSD